MGIVRILFSLYGRIGRTTYVALIILNIVASAAIHGTLGPDRRSGEDLSFAVLALSLVLSYIGIAAAVKRFHDRDKSGWWLLMPMGLFAAAGAVAFGQGVSPTAPQAGAGILVFALAGIGIVASLWQAIELLFFGPVDPGDGSVNRFGTRIPLFEDAEPAPTRQGADEAAYAQGGSPAPEPARPARRVPPPPLPGGQKAFGRRGLT